jgi:ribosome biogenesis ATPase
LKKVELLSRVSIPPASFATMPQLQTRLDWDVYHVLRKIEEQEENDDKPQLTIYSLSDYIRKSNSSLARVKKKPLEVSIDRALKFWKEEKEGEAEDEDTDMDDTPASSAPASNKHDSDILNKQLVKRWNVAKREYDDSNSAQEREKLSPAKKRKPARSLDRGGGQTEPDSQQPTAGRKKEGPEARKRARPKGYTVEGKETSDLPALGGISDVVADLDNIFSAFASPERPHYDPENSRSVALVLSGPEESGKSSIVKFLARKWKVAVLTVSCGSLAKEDKPERVLQDVLEEARTLGPCMIHLHRYETLWSSADSHHNTHMPSDEPLEDLLSALEADRDSEPPRHTAVIATTNRPEAIPDVFLSSHLIAKHYPLKIPSEQSRQQILKVLAPIRRLPNDFDFAAVARLTHGYLAGDLASLIKEAQFIPRPEGRLIAVDDFKKAMRQYKPVLYRQGFSPVPDVTLDSVGGLEDTVELLRDTILVPIQNPDAVWSNGGQPEGILLWGPPGCGKTLVAQAIANAAQAAFILVNGPELLDKYVGESERKIRALFERARACAPCLIFFDEFDGIAPNRSAAGTEASTRVVNTFLAEMDGAKKRAGVYLIAATNRPDMLDPALLRPGRFSQEVYVGLPTQEERVDIIRKATRDYIPSCTPADLALTEDIAKHEGCNDFSGADIAQLCRRARGVAIKVSGSSIPRLEHWLQALATQAPSVRDIDTYEAMRKNREVGGRRRRK